jgi:hypothetical protein
MVLLQTAWCGLISLVTSCLLATLQLKQNLLVALHSHHDLAVDVLDVHVLSAIASMGPHQRCLVSGMACCNVVDCSRCCCILQRGSQIVWIVTGCGSLLD